MVGERNARSGRLRVIDQNVDSAEGFDRLIDHPLNDREIVSACVDVCLNGQHANAVEPLQLFLHILELFDIAPRNYQISALFA